MTLGKVPTILKNLYNKNAWTIEDEKESRKACDAKDLKAFEEAWLANHLKINDWWNAFAICVLFARNAAAVHTLAIILCCFHVLWFQFHELSLRPCMEGLTKINVMPFAA